MRVLGSRPPACSGTFPHARIVAKGVNAKGVNWQVMAHGVYESILANGPRNTVDLTRRGAATRAVVCRWLRGASGQ